MTREERQKAAAEAARAALAAPELEVEEDEYFEPPEEAEGGIAVAEPEEPEPPRELTPFEKFVAALDADVRELLSDEELRQDWEAAQVAARAERRKSARALAKSKAKLLAGVEEGTIEPETAEQIAWRERMQEMVDFHVEMPHAGTVGGENAGPIDIGLRIDQKVYAHGKTYRVTRAQAESMRANLWQARQNELLFEGKDRRNWLRRQATGTQSWHIG